MLRQFTLDFFQQFGAEIEADSGKGAPFLNGVRVKLTPELAAHFGKPYLHLVFSAAEASVYHDLIVYGSRTFDGIMAYLERVGEFTRQALPALHAGDGETLPAEISLNRCRLADLHAYASSRPVVAFNFHITYRSDDKVEELYSMALDGEGRVIENFHSLLQAAGPELADSASAPFPNGEPFPNGVVELAVEARKHASFHADVRCAELEQDILPRLHKALSRLVTYYEEQIAEIYDGRNPAQAEERRQMMRDDLKRKIAEETENHRLRVTVRLFSFAVILSPTWRTEARLDNTRTALTVGIERDLYTGQLYLPGCHACGSRTTSIGICDGGHVACPADLLTCFVCGQDRCTACGVQPCMGCGEPVCRACATTCQACGGWACAEHSLRCPVCQDLVCQACQGTCGACGSRQCAIHLLSDHISRELVCRTCAVTCPACEQPSAHTGTCAVCGQVFCQACLETCCICAKPLCPAHRAACAVCGAAHCVSHIATCTTCGCSICAEHSLACPDCDDIVCPQHTAHCALCGQAYSSKDVNAHGVCIMCASLASGPLVADMGGEAVARDKRVRAIARNYVWRKASNRLYTVYLGQRTLGKVLIVADSHDQVIELRTIGLLGSLLGRKLSRP
ncbi:MAG: hypothetical protein JW850_11640 [Thermoflexales bacterium]|nr:hypothetical protein [Thermoflexales bacterium]